MAIEWKNNYMKIKQYLADYKKIALLACPVMLSNATDTLMMMVDRLFLSRFGTEAEVLLGGSMSGGMIAWLILSPMIGLLSYTNAMASQNFGRGKLPRCTQIISHAMYLALLYYPLALLISSFIPAVLIWAKHDPALIEAEQTYSYIIIYGSIFSLLRIPLNSFFIATNRSGLVMKISFIGLLFNIPLNYWFIFDQPLQWGNGSLRPGLLGIGNGIAGAASATVASQILTFMLLLLLFFKQKREYQIAQSWHLRPSIYQELLRYGLPASLEVFTNLLSFNTFLIMFYSISPLIAAAGTIIFSWDSLNFIILMGVNMATTTLVGQNLGANNPAKAQYYTRLILIAALLFSGVMALFFLLVPDLLSKVFIAEGIQEKQALLDISRSFLRLAAIYSLADALGMVMHGALNGAGDTFATMSIYVSMNLILIIGAIVLLKVLHLGAMGLWLFFIIHVLISNTVLACRYASGRWKQRWQNP